MDKEKEIREIRRKAITANLKLIECPIRHLGTEEGYKIYTKLQHHLEEKGVEIRFLTMVEELLTEKGRVIGVRTDHGDSFYAPEVVAGVGREGSEWFSNTCRKLGIETENGTVDVGVRVEVRDEIMKELNEQTVIMTAEERAEFEAFQREKAKKAAEEKAKADREMYKQMVDEEIENSIPVLLGISEEIKESKQKVLDNFKAILAMKSDLFKTKMRNDQRSHTFTNSAGDKRITLGVYVTDGYRDTVEDGIAIVKEYIASLANDEKTQALVNMVFRLLSRDAKGTLKASRIVQLRKVAEDTGDARFMEGVRIIEESYQPEVSKQFIRAEMKDRNGMWRPIPLGMTES